jgi:hypothetical protein
MSSSKRHSGGRRAKRERHRGQTDSPSETANERRNDQEDGAQVTPDPTEGMTDIGLPDVIMAPEHGDKAGGAQASDHGNVAGGDQASDHGNVAGGDQASDHGNVAGGAQASEARYLIDRSFDFFQYLIDKATESKEAQRLLLRAGRHVRRSLRLVFVFLVICALMFGTGIGFVVWVAGLKPLAALLVGLAGSATLGLIGGLAVRTWYLRAKQFLQRAAQRSGS